MIDEQVRQAIRALPKIELHRHLEGAVRLETLVEIARDHEFEMPEYEVETLRPFVQMMPSETRNAQHFLGKFYTIRQFFRSPAAIRRIAREAVLDAAADNVRYLELRFTPRALSNVLNCTYETVVEWVTAEVQQAASEEGIEARLILSMNRHESVEIGEAVLDVALAFRERGVVAIDLAGNEGEFSAEPFLPVFERARKAGLGVTIHAGEWGGADNIRYAIEHLGAQRIGHGVRLTENTALMEWVIQRQVTLEVCPTSNVHSGVVADWSQHPLKCLLSSGVSTTLNTDDPLISDIVLSDELIQAVDQMALTLDDIKAQILNAAHSAFLPDSERTALAQRFAGWLGVTA